MTANQPQDTEARYLRRDDPPEWLRGPGLDAQSPPGALPVRQGLKKLPKPGSSPRRLPRVHVGTSPVRPERGLIAAALVLALAIAGGSFALGASTNDAVESPAPPPAEVPPPPPVGLEEPVADVARRLLPSVVQIETATGVGSGVVYQPGGLILTAAHVVENVEDVTVRLSNGRRTSATVVGAHQETDVAVIRAKIRNLPVAQLALGEPLSVGQIAVAIGSPFGLAASVTSGVVSAIERPVTTEGGRAPMIQTDAPINPGNSGGALADRDGQVIGINDLIRTTTGANAGIGFAIPIDVAAPVADALVKGKTPRLGFLGVVGSDAAQGAQGALITQVRKGTPAAKAGLRKGDVVTSVGGQPIHSMAELTSAIRLTRPGKKLMLDVLRKGRTLYLTVRVGAQ